MLRDIKDILMERDGLSEEEAKDRILDAKAELQCLLEDGDLVAAEDICKDHFGLEPDYVIQLLDF